MSARGCSRVEWRGLPAIERTGDLECRPPKVVKFPVAGESLDSLVMVVAGPLGPAPHRQNLFRERVGAMHS